MRQDDGASIDRPTEKEVAEFTCELLEDRTDETSLLVYRNGKTARIPRSMIEYRRIDSEGLTVLRIPAWLYRREFEEAKS